MIRTRSNLRNGPGFLEVIPLINVLFLLLLFFLLANSMVFQAGIPVELPAAVQPEMRAAEKLIVTLTRTGLLFFNDKPVQWDELERELRDLVLDRRLVLSRRLPGDSADAVRTPLLVLRADRAAPYARVVEIMSLARALNLGVYLITDAPRDPRAAPGTTPPTAE